MTPITYNRKSPGPACNAIDRSGRCSEPAAVLACARRFGLWPVQDQEFEVAQGFAQKLIGPAIASLEIFKTVQSITGASVFRHQSAKGDLDGVFAGFALNQAGARQCAEARFDPLRVPASLIAAAGQEPHAWYGWGFAASSKKAAFAVVSAARAIQSELFWAVPAYARAVSPQGERITRKIGYSPAPGSDFLWIAPQARRSSGVAL